MTNKQEIQQENKSIKKMVAFRLILIAIFGGITALDGIISPILIGKLMDNISKKEFSTSFILLVVFLLCFVLVNTSFWIWRLLSLNIRKIINKWLRSQAVASYNNHPQLQSSKILNFINVTIKQFENQIIDSVIMLIYCIEQAVITLFFVIKINPILGLTYLILGFIPAVVPFVFKKWLSKSTDRWNKSYQRYSLHTTEYFNGFYTIKRFESLLIFKDKLNNLLNDSENKYYQMDADKEHSRFVSNLLYSLSTILSLGLGVYFVSIGQLTAGALMSLYLAADRVTSPIISSIQFTNQLLSSRPLIDSCQKIISTKEKPINNIEPQKFTDKTVLKIDDGSFGYDKAIIHNLSFSASSGEKILISGRSGIGKTTIVKTMLNELKLLGGTIKYSKELYAKPIYDNIGVLAQETTIFTGTLLFNLCLGQNYPTTSILQVLHEVGLTKFANENALNMRLGEGANALSGGEKRKLELARLLLRNKKLLLVDEALSGLDKESYGQVFDLILNFPGTVIDIEHNVQPAFAKKYDKVIELDQYAL